MISDERLKQAVHEAAKALDRSLPDPEACTYEPSPEFEARMQTLIREMGEKRERKERRRKLAHRAACLAIAVVACGGCFLGSNAQAREGLWGWIRDSFEGSQNYSFQSTPIPSGDLPAYTMDVPEEYHYVTDQSIQSAEYAALTYENDAGNILALDYQYETENSSGSLSVFADEEDVQKVKAELQEAFPKLILAGEYALENCVGNLDAVINEMNATTPDVIVSILPSPLQEHFFAEHKDKMSATIWFGMGELGVHGKKHGLGSFVKNRLHLGRLKNSMNKYQDQEKSGEAE